jgi:hypothetical protein
LEDHVWNPRPVAEFLHKPGLADTPSARHDDGGTTIRGPSLNDELEPVV